MTRVLVVDDELDARHTMREILQGSGFDVSLARTGSIAVRIQRENPATVVVLDMRLKKMDGIETCRRIREFDSIVEFVGVSNYDEEYRHRAAQAGIDLWVPKPLVKAKKRDKLVQAVRRASGTSIGRSLSTFLPVAPLVPTDGTPPEHSAGTYANSAVPPLPPHSPVEVQLAHLLLRAAQLLDKHEISRELFTRAFLSELSGGQALVHALQRIQTHRLVSGQERDLILSSRLVEEQLDEEGHE